MDLWASADWYGSENLRVRATDPSGAFAEGAFLATVRPVNDPPFVTVALSPVAFDEDTTATDVFSGAVSTHFSDVDGDTFTYMIMGMVQVSSRINANLTVDLWAAANWFGTENLRVRATDPNGSWVEAPFVVTVRPVNDPPILATPFPAVGFGEDTTATNVFGGDAATHFFDIDGDLLTITVLGGTQVSSRVNLDRTVDMWAPANWSGSENLRVRATDPSGTFAEGSSIVTVSAVNDAPIVLSTIPTVTFDEDTVRLDAFSGPPVIYFFDRDGDPLTYSVLGATQILSRVNADSTIDFWAPQDWYGPESVYIRATDSSGDFAEATLLVVVSPINDAPVLAPISDLLVDDGATTTFDLTPYISDIDTNMSDITVTTDNQYVTANGRVLTIAFPAGQNETTFTITISDGSATASRSVKISFNPAWGGTPYMLAAIPFGILLVVGMIAQRARWRPAKAFLVDDRRRLIREFTLDPRCEVTYEQTMQAGALDAVEKAVKVEKYHAQTVQGDALAVCLLAYGPVSMEQVEFAREMLVNVQDKFDEGVKIRLQAARTAEDNLEDSNRELQGKWDA
ncbi:MAG TPA: tandem-95 repeat protein, partial [Candidatus Paceibacterota bacterium]|nr:tandem-95 repeat protein [Candidatus Paceibacterota bacterium]